MWSNPFVLFLSTLPARGATGNDWVQWASQSDFYPRSPRGERPFGPGLCHYHYKNFYPRSPRGERHKRHLLQLLPCNFYPRSPRGERPRLLQHYNHQPRHFYPRSPRGERPSGRAFVIIITRISIHAPREGSDHVYRLLEVFISISIHAPREGSDSITSSVRTDSYGFLSTLPARGATPSALWPNSVPKRFLSTLPARGATANVLKNKRLPSAAFV